MRASGVCTSALRGRWRDREEREAAEAVDVVQHGANAGVHVIANRSEGGTQVGSGELGVGGKDSVSFHDFLSGEIQSVVVEGLNLLNFLVDESCVGHGGHHVAGSSLALGANHGGAFPDATNGFTEPGGAANEGNAVVVFVDVEVGVGWREDFTFVHHVNAHRFQNSCLTVVADT